MVKTELSTLISDYEIRYDPIVIRLVFFAAKSTVTTAGGSAFYVSDSEIYEIATNDYPFIIDHEHPLTLLLQLSDPAAEFQVHPILLDGTRIGYLVCSHAKNFEPHLIRLLSDIEVSLVRARAQRKLNRTSSELRYKTLEVESLIDIMSILDGSPSMTDETYTTLLFTIVSVLNASKGMILLRESSSGVFSPIAHINMGESELPKGPLTKKRGLLQLLLQREYVENGGIFGADDGHNLLKGVTKNALVCPIIDHDELIGCIIAIDKETRLGLTKFHNMDLRLCNNLTKKISLVHRNLSLLDSLNKSSKLVDSIMSSVTTGLIKLNPFGEIEYVNLAAERILGLTYDEIRDQHYAAVFEKNNDVISTLSNLEVNPQQLYVENSLIFDQSETGRNVNLTFSPVYTEFGEVDGFVISLEDLSALSKITATFKRYVSKDIVDTVLNQNGDFEMSGKQQEVCVLFSDLRGFTQMSERMTPEQILNILNQYFEVMIDLVFQHGGVLDKIVGDELMVLYGAPTKSDSDIDNAVKTALKMFETLDTLNEKIEAEGFQRLKMGIGINFGQVVSGNIGSKRQMNYTVIGDEVNIASRLCDNASPGEILISRSVYDHFSGGLTGFEKMSPLRVKGKALPVEIWSYKHKPSR